MDETILPLPRIIGEQIDETSRYGRDPEDLVAGLYAKLRPSLLSYAYYLVGSTLDAEDVVQAAFLQLFDQLSNEVEIRNMRGWLYRVVHNLAVEHARRTGKRDSLLRGWLADRGHATSAITAEEELVRREQIEQALAALNERERHALMLRAEGLSYQEIAGILEISVKSVSVYLARGLKKFEPKR